MNRSQRRKMLKDAGLLGKQAEKNGIKIVGSFSIFKGGDKSKKII